jgi:hypothetical protein
MPSTVDVQDPLRLEALQRIAAQANAANGRVPVLQRPIKFSTPGDINSSVNPQFEAALKGFTGTAPQDLGASVFNPQSQSINRAGELGYLAGQALNAAPAYGAALKYAAPKAAEAAGNYLRSSGLAPSIVEHGPSSVTPDAFWMNANTKHIEPFPVTGMHVQTIQNPAYAAKLGVTPEQAFAYPIADEAKPLLMGRRTGDSMSINSLDNVTKTHLKAAQQAVENAPPDVTRIHFGGGDKIFENVPIDQFKSAKSFKDLAPQPAPEAAPTAPTEPAPTPTPAPVPEQKMLQGFYRGYAGDYGSDVAGADGTSLYVTPQKPVADYYANNRAALTGQDPHAEMVLADPFAGRSYGHSTRGTGEAPPMFTRARELQPEDVQGVTQLYAKGGSVSVEDPVIIEHKLKLMGLI